MSAISQHNAEAPFEERFLTQIAHWRRTLNLSKDELVDWLLNARLAGLTYKLLDPQKKATPMGQKLKTGFLNSAAHTMIQNEVFDRFQAVAGTLNIQPVLLKGAALGQTVYPHPATRPMGDIDIWLPQPVIPPLIARLEEAGFKLAKKQLADHQITAQQSGEYQLIYRDWHILIELHDTAFPGWWLDQTTPIAVDEGAIWERCEPLEGRPGYRQMDATDMLIHVATHLAVNHQFSLHPLRSLVDLALLIEKRPPDWDRLCVRAARWHLQPVLWRTLLALQEIWLVEVPLEVVNALAPKPLQRQILTTLVTTKSLLAEHNHSDAGGRYVLLLALVEQGAARRRLIKTALWPKASELPPGVDNRFQRLWRVITTREL
ncbi:MAG: nucleotidyltransferase family protein [Ardenticatenaceae bacterium]|nr:nucleotidyltransferase family protein [Ardenticatenaceae bacterium]